MFTGIVEELGEVESIDPRGAGAKLRVRARKVLEDAFEGASIAVNGICLTAAGLRPGSFGADVSPETFRRGNLAGLRPGSPVNLERPLAASGRLGGHIVYGHVDGVGSIREIRPLGEARVFHLQADPSIMKFVVYKGAIAVDGVSLTVAGLGDREFDVMVVPYTWTHTALCHLRPGDKVNLECDMIGKHVVRALEIDEELPDPEEYETLAGFLMHLLRRVPRRTDVVRWGGFQFEVMDVDAFRIDQVLVTRLPAVAERPRDPAY